MVGTLKESGISISHFAINPSYSLARQFVKKIPDDKKNLMETAVNLDIQYFSSMQTYKNIISDHIIIFGIK